jgi:hypothetical protein
MYKEFVVATK